MKRDPKKFSLLGLLLGAVALLSSPIVHAQVNTGIEFGASTGLGGENITTVIARIIQVFLGILGIVALVLVIYAGFLWMTAGGDEAKVGSAKKILAQAVIGLIIILSSFAITSFVVSRLVSATTGGVGDGGGGGGGDGGGGVLPTGQFVVSSITPPGSKDATYAWPKNSQIRVVLKNGIPDPATISGSISVMSSGTPVSGTIEARGNVLIFTATAECTENPRYTCLPGNSALSVVISNALASSTGKFLHCGLCVAAFNTNDLLDTENPKVAISSPTNGQSVPSNSFVPVVADASDDSAIADIEFSANEVSLGSAGVGPWQIDWDTTGLPEGSRVTLKATATDAVGNTALATPITVTIRPAHCFNAVKDSDETGLNCGGSCGACPGGTCAVSSDCASGLCVAGICVARPRIDSVSPLSGGPGTLVTIKGASFGNVAKEVMFLGAEAAGDEKIAALCAPSAWSDTQIIVTLPEGTISGPIQVTNKDNRSDRTDDDFGNVSIPDFTVNTEVRPGICTLTPSAGPVGTSVVIAGTGFGDAQGSGSVNVSGRSAAVQSWSGSRITMAMPNVLGGLWPVAVVANGVDSNSALFSVPVSGGGKPHLLSIDPGSGPKGEYVTIVGTNFGNAPGRIIFANGPDKIEGGIDFPPACIRDYWRSTTVTVKVPTGLLPGNLKVSMMRVDGESSDNDLDFELATGDPSPGICRIDPASGPVGTTYAITGERLGADKGKVFFRDNVEATSLISSWNAIRVSGAVPVSSVTGRVYLNSAAGGTSNSLNFTVADCRKAQICTGSDECCTDGTCRPPNADGGSGCVAPKLGGSYRYRFSTGDVPLVPAVVEEVTCATRAQSPSPFIGVNAACVNSIVSARFTIGMDKATLNSGNFIVTDCGNGATFDAGACQAAVAGTVSSIVTGQPLEDTINFTPSARLLPNEWYLARISTAARSAAGIPLAEDYFWHFRVRNSPDSCAIESIAVSPYANKLTDLYQEGTRDGNENVTYSKYKAIPSDKICNQLNCADYSWQWRATPANVAGIVNSQSCTPEVQALHETSASVPATISASSEDRTGDGFLAIKFIDPKVIGFWPAKYPDCQGACRQAEIAVSFSTTLDPATVNSSTVRLFHCNNENCQSYSEPVSGAMVSYREGSVNGTPEHLAVISGVTPMDTNAFYRVIVMGGGNGVKSPSTAELADSNFAYTVGGMLTPAYSWVFRVGDKDCAVSTIQMSPDKVVTSVVGSYHGLTAVPKTGSDACAMGGERIDVSGLDWNWSVAPPTPGAASLYAAGSLNVKPLASSYATANCLNTGTDRNAALCGNNTREKGEECDDGNTVSGDGCSRNCLLESFAATCGNSQIDSKTLVNGNTVSEQCDDGNKTDNDGCSSSCLREGSPYGSNPSICGNGSIGDNEQCDDGNAIAGDGCSPICTNEGSKPGPFSICGNGLKEDGEDCDNGSQNGVSGSGCSVRCLAVGVRMSGSTFAVEPPSVCGDGTIGQGETFDPGSADNRVDATQYAKAEGIGNTLDKNGKMVSMITVSSGGKIAQAEFALQCGYKSDENCPAGTRLGANSCCYPPPAAISITPERGAVNICRNPLIEVEFDGEMDPASFKDKFIVGGPVPSAGCSADKKMSTGFLRGLMARLGSFVTRVAQMVTGKAVGAAPPYCQVAGAVTVETRLIDGVKRSFARFNLSAVLAPNVEYKVILDRSVKNLNGVTLGSSVEWTFTTGADICTLDQLVVDPPSKLFTQTYSGVRSDESDQDFVAIANHLDASGALLPIAPVPGVYDWQIGWVSSNKTLVNGLSIVSPADPPNGTTASIGIKKQESGEAVLTANAKIIADKLNKTSSVDRVVAGVSDITVMLCNNPWPARKKTASGFSWSPAFNNTYNYGFFYCRDGSDGAIKLPDLKETPAIPANTAALKDQGLALDQYLYTFTDPKLASDGIGVRVAENHKHLSPTAWYAAQGFKGSIKQLTVDGYEAVQEGQTVYVSAPALLVPSGGALLSNYTNIYIISATVGSGADTKNIFNQILKNIRFAANRDSAGKYVYNDQNICETALGVSCASDLDCASGQCLAQRSKIRRDVKRMADLVLIAEAVERARSKTGSYPAMAFGSFLPGQTMSVWPSWAQEFAREIGGTPPVDPLNKLGKCDAYASDGTCWSPAKQAAICPLGSHVYRYMYPNNSLYSYTPEALGVNYTFICDDPMVAKAACEAYPLCAWGSENGTQSCSRRFSNLCANTVISASAAVCGNGMIENGEQCEKTIAPTRTFICGKGAFETDGCGSNCQWMAGACAVPKCGNGTKEGGEVCDQGALNGTYGHCDTACAGIGTRCGDGITQQGEICDNGAGNGVYQFDGLGCSFDCRSRGEWCGDRVTNGGEQCDGNSMTSIDALGYQSACPLDSAGHAQTRTINCAPSCVWGAWGICLPTGTCGNGNQDSASEQCDQGVGNSDTAACTTQCRNAVCGDGLVWTKHEQCDNGAGNINPATNPEAIAALRGKCSLASCYYCSNSCVATAVTGRYCGDKTVDADIGEQCEIGDVNTRACTVNGYDGTATQSCGGSCKWGSYDPCVASAYCGDAAKNGPEKCDMGMASNDGAPGHCKADCSGQICAITETLVTSNVASLSPGVSETTVTTNPDYTTGAVPVTDVGVAYNGGTYIKLNNPSVQYVWSATYAPPENGVTYESKYFQQKFTLNCDLPQGTKFILNLNIDDDVNVYINGTLIPPNASDAPSVAAGRTMSNLKSPGYKPAQAIDVTGYINKTGENVLRFEARNYFGPALLAYWLETTQQ